MWVAEQGSVSERIQLLLGLAHKSIQASFHVWKFLANVIDQDLYGDVSLMPNVDHNITYLVQRLRQISRS